VPGGGPGGGKGKGRFAVRRVCNHASVCCVGVGLCGIVLVCAGCFVGLVVSWLDWDDGDSVTVIPTSWLVWGDEDG
jgi:hypothetical protein